MLFSACTGTLFGPAGGGAGAVAALVAPAERAGVGLITLADPGSSCCGTPWKFKGLRAGYDEVAARVVPALLEATRGGELPVVCDASSCTEGLLHLWRSPAAGPALPPLQVLDATRFVADGLLDRLPVTRRLGSVVLHPTCSPPALGVLPAMVAITQHVADEVVVPQDAGCCGYAGDRGLLHPELTASATAREAAEVTGRGFDAHCSANRTCELGLTRATGRSHRHVLEVVEETTWPAPR